MVIMIKHIVLWKFLETAGGCTKAENMARAKELLLALPPIIPQIKSMQVGEDMLHTDASYDMALIVTAENAQTLGEYISHLEHQKVSEFIGTVRESRVCADIEE